VGDTLYGKPAGSFWRSPNVKSAGNIPLFLDCWFWCGWPDDSDTPPAFDGNKWAGDTDSMNRFCINRHQQAINGVFLDYSINRIGLKQLWRLRWSRRFNIAVEPAWPDWMRGFKDY
jgi:hypothetical protein